jgi:oxygen-dependent protoporphyrinogen oxidase
MSKTVHIIGSGFSGLTLAWELVGLGFDVHIYDQSERTGGLIGSVRTPTHLREFAANGILWNDRLQKLGEELGLSFLPASTAAKKRFIFRRKELHRWPLLPTETIGFAGKLSRFFFHAKIRKDLNMKPQPYETIAHWCERNATPAIHEFLIKPALQGIYAGETSEMSASLVLKALGGSRGTYAPKDGMGALIQSLERQLLKKGVRFSMNSKMGEELPPQSEPLVVATSAWAAAEILKTRAPQVSMALSKIQALPLVSVTAVWNKANSQIPGFGCLFPPLEKFHALGVLANRNIFSERGPGYSETWILGGALKQNICQFTDAELQSQIMQDRQWMLDSSQKPDEIYIRRYEKALPHYNIELEKILENLSLPQDLFLTGNYLGRLGLAKIYDQNIELAGRIGKIYG